MSIFVAILAVAACRGGPGPSRSAESGVDVPVEDLSAFDKCMLDNGFRIVKVHEGYPGEKPWYEWESALSEPEANARFSDCQRLAPAPRERTDAELRAIYDRWVQEAECLQRLGYSPKAAPSFEKWAADWRSTGPWQPIDGVDYTNWSTAQFSEAKEKCTLEMYDR